MGVAADWMLMRRFLTVILEVCSTPNNETVKQ